MEQQVLTPLQACYWGFINPTVAKMVSVNDEQIREFVMSLGARGVNWTRIVNKKFFEGRDIGKLDAEYHYHQRLRKAIRLALFSQRTTRLPYVSTSDTPSHAAPTPFSVTSKSSTPSSEIEQNQAVVVWYDHDQNQVAVSIGSAELRVADIMATGVTKRFDFAEVKALFATPTLISSTIQPSK